MPCHVTGCKFLTTSNAGLKNHLRIHAPELRAKRRREQARRERGNITNNTLDDDWNNISSNLHEDDHDNEKEVENDDDDDDDDETDHDERRNPSRPQRDANHSTPEDIQYHPIINGACML